MKRVFAFVLAALMTAALAGCGNSASSSQAGSSLSSHEESAASSVVESSQEESATAGTGMKDLYSDLSLTPIDDATLKDLYMVDPENVDSYVGEMSMINVQAFDILVVKAKKGKVEDVKAALEERKQNRISEFEFYAVNNNDENTKNALVLTSGDYAILVICDNYEEAQKILDEYFTF